MFTILWLAAPVCIPSKWHSITTVLNRPRVWILPRINLLVCKPKSPEHYCNTLHGTISTSEIANQIRADTEGEIEKLRQRGTKRLLCPLVARKCGNSIDSSFSKVKPKRCSDVNENLLTTKPRICACGKEGKIIYPPTLTFFWRRQVSAAALTECDARNPELHLLMQNWEVTIVSRQTIAVASSTSSAGLCAIHFLHMSFSREGLSNPAAMESMDESEGRQGQLHRKEQPLKTSQRTALLGWAARWNGLMPGDSMYLFVLSQILVRQLVITLLKCWDPSFKLSLGGFLLICCRCSNRHMAPVLSFLQ